MSLNSFVRDGGEVIVTSGNRLAIDTASDFSRIIREALESSHLVAIEFEPEVELDITCVQILCSACKSAANSGKVFTYHGLKPQALSDIIASCGAERRSVCKHNNESTCIWFGGTN